jgi:hypothetical protein
MGTPISIKSSNGPYRRIEESKNRENNLIKLNRTKNLRLRSPKRYLFNGII